MESLAHILQSAVSSIAEVCIPMVQLVGILILMFSAAKCTIAYVRKEKHVGVSLAHGLALALEFMLGAEVLHIVLAHDWKELGVLGIGVVIHVLLTLLLHKEVKDGQNESKENAPNNE